MRRDLKLTTTGDKKPFADGHGCVALTTARRDNRVEAEEWFLRWKKWRGVEEVGGWRG
ncbi:hypothetical protein Hanom_Chr11g01001321 [Helianthus anomalus]